MVTEHNTPMAGVLTLPRTASAWLAALAVGLAALAPRALGLADFYTIDESYHWIGRVERFAAALAAGDWAATNQTGHPGVTTMWLGALGDALARALGVPNPGWAGGGAHYLALLRLPLAAANGLAVALGYLLLRRLLRPATALLAALMWALSPFLIAHGRLLHLDALLTSFMTLSILALLIATNDERRTTNDERRTTDDERRTTNGERRPDAEERGLTTGVRYRTTDGRRLTIRGRWVVASGMLGGLALLTKAPSLLLLPLAGLILASMAISRHRPEGEGQGDGAGRQAAAGSWWSVVGGHFALWLACAVAVVFALWPAMWVMPIATYGDVLREIRDNGAQPHHSGNFFLGQPVGVPDARFYPAVVLWRTTPLTLIGLLALTASSMLHGAFGVPRPMPHATRGSEGTTLFALAGFALLFTLALTLQAKKLDRYLLPIFPALEILAAAGLVRIADYRGQLADWLARRSASFKLQSASFNRLAWSLVTLLLAANLLGYHPYYLSYFNPLLGGGAVAQRVMLVGLGEGMEQVGAWLSARPDLGRGDVLSWIPPTLAPFVPRSTLVRDLRPAYLRRPSSYAVLYVRSVQHQESAEAEAYVRQSPPLFTLRMHGVEYATVHQLPRPFAVPVGAVFGEGLHLRGFTSERVGSTLVITPSWDIQASRPGGVVSFVHVLAPDGRRVAQVDAPLDQGMFAAWQAGQQFDSPLPIPLPPDLAPGEYRLALGLYTPADGARLPLTRGMPLPDALAGPHAILLGTLQVP
ncbi:MAG TPA: glycosyltransferase family 39 protein [Roseiflexaceae bacterium]|nr:glycosyltransferase family 39 protein [Roseiflexaceae bacterium]